TNATIARAQGVGTIPNDDPQPSLSIGSASVTEGNSGTTPMTVTVFLSAASGRTVTVNYATADGTATAGSDYTATSGTLAFAPGETSKTVAVTVLGDTSLEADETFGLALSGPVNAKLARASATGTIRNDDTAPKVRPGIYCGNTDQGPPLCLTTSPDGSGVIKLTTSSLVDCSPPVRFEFQLSFSGGFTPILPDLTFSFTYSGPLSSGSRDVTHIQTSYFLKGT